MKREIKMKKESWHGGRKIGGRIKGREIKLREKERDK